MKRVSLALAALALSSTPADAAKLTLPPVDQCSSQAGFAEFRQSLEIAVQRRNEKALLDLLAPDVMVNFGGDSGRQAFARQWGFSQKDQSPLWAELETILALGCALHGEAALIPSLAGQFNPEDDQDLFEKVVVISDKAELRAGTEPGSKVLAKLAWNVVNSVEASGDVYMKVRLADGREGWLPADQLRSPLDYRAVIEKRDGQWLITAFVAGD